MDPNGHKFESGYYLYYFYTLMIQCKQLNQRSDISRIWNRDDKSPDNFHYKFEKLIDWTNTRSLRLNFSKCKVMHVVKK